jgi:hypothetical protein
MKFSQIFFVFPSIIFYIYIYRIIIMTSMISKICVRVFPAMIKIFSPLILCAF